MDEARRLDAQFEHISVCFPFLFNGSFLIDRFISVNLLVGLVFLEMDLGTKKALEVKKAAALQIKAGSLSAPTAKTSHERKSQGNGERPLKKIVSQPVASNLMGP